ncbi:MAG: acetyl-CoA carboxylase biotin carboxyl carrier protein [Planctomycetaceae bacterium]|nr:acetyl-CoA carboxylase biotin carboxyl carrier protein [Planctomycetaceae bacterium]
MGEKSTIDLKQVKDLIELMKENDLAEIEVEAGDSKIHLKRPGGDMRMIQYQPMPAAAVPMGAAPALAAAPAAAAPAAEEKFITITSPIVGTFYQAPSPDSEPYVRVGSKVDADTVVCIVEAMKVMNEIKAEASGTVVEVCCKDGQAVEFGQLLFKIRP